MRNFFLLFLFLMPALSFASACFSTNQSDSSGGPKKPEPALVSALNELSTSEQLKDEIIDYWKRFGAKDIVTVVSAQSKTDFCSVGEWTVLRDSRLGGEVYSATLKFLFQEPSVQVVNDREMAFFVKKGAKPSLLFDSMIQSHELGALPYLKPERVVRFDKTEVLAMEMGSDFNGDFACEGGKHRVYQFFDLKNGLREIGQVERSFEFGACDVEVAEEGYLWVHGKRTTDLNLSKCPGDDCSKLKWTRKTYSGRDLKHLDLEDAGSFSFTLIPKPEIFVHYQAKN
jgi:hypothetical protein